MSQVSIIDIPGNNPEIPTEFIEDVGTAVPIANQLEILGQKTSADVPVVTTHGSGKTVTIENRTWETAYVVDPSATVGDRGTFTTIQSAYDAIVADGVAAPGKYGVILIRPGDYTENLLINQAAPVMFKGLSPDLSDTAGTSVTINGTVTCDTSNQPISFENVTIIELIMGQSPVTATNCGIYAVTGTSAPAGLSKLYLNGCFVQDVNTNGVNFTAYNSSFQYSSVFTIANALFNKIINCSYNSGSNALQFTGTSNAEVINCTRMNIGGNTTGTIAIQNTSLLRVINLPNANLQTSGVYLASTISGGSATALTSQVPTVLLPESEGNIASRRVVTTSGNVTRNDQYVGCNQSASITLTLTGSYCKGQRITIADESGSGATNTITVSPSSGTINGSSSLVLASNYGSMTIIYDGTNWFTSVFLTSSTKITTLEVADSPGNFAKDSKSKYIRVIEWGGGGGGGSGRKGTTAASCGGGGGGVAGCAVYEGPASFFNTIESFFVGQGGTGGVAQTADATNGNPGNPGTNTTFGNIIALGGTFGQGGTTAVGAGGSAIGRGVYSNLGAISANSTQSGGGSLTAGNAGASSGPGGTITGRWTIGPSCAGGGGGADSTTPRAGGAGGAFLNVDGSSILSAPAGGLEATGINGANGNSTAITGGLMLGGQGGGGGGGYSTGAGGNTSGGNGGNGSIPGGPGGGGGGGLSAVANSGAGGNGADGRIVVIEYL